MKKFFKSTMSIVLAIVLLLTAIPLSGFKGLSDLLPIAYADLNNVDKLPDDIHSYPKQGQKYWVIFNEGLRSNRLELSTFDVTSGTQPYIIWNNSMRAYVKDGAVSRSNQFHYTDTEWIYDRQYGILTDKATRVFASNVPIYDIDGNLLLSATTWIDIGSSTFDISQNAVGDIIEFGSYPQSKVTDDTTISYLNNVNKIWKSYGYYSGNGDYGSMAQGDWMQYCDVVYNGVKYRGVYFTKYRPFWTETSNSINNSHQYDNGYYTNTYYWFKYEPLRWRVLDPNEGFVLSENLIDSQPYQNLIYRDSNDYYYNNPEKTVYANDYVTSSIRKWLNDDFYNTAFTSEEKARIGITSLDNSAKPGYPQYDSQTTNDKIFLISWNEMINADYGFSTNSGSVDTAREAKSTDYAKSQGGRYIYVSDFLSHIGNGEWWLRSPGDYSNGACYVHYDGWMNSSWTEVSSSGVRPAFKFNPQSGISESFNLNTSEINKSSENQTITFYPKNADALTKGSFLDWAAQFNSWLSGVKAVTAVGEKDINATVSFKKSEIENSSIVLKKDGYRNYIIPSAVLKNLTYIDIIGDDYAYTAYMAEDRKDGKPYISTVFGRISGKDAEYKNLATNTLKVTENEKQDIIISADALNGRSAAYYISQDESHKVSSNNGIFSSVSLYNTLDFSKDVYAYAVCSDGTVTESVKIKLEKDVPKTKETEEFLKGSTISLVGKDGQAITLSDDIPLVGGAEISLDAFKFPVGIDINGNNVKISLGLNIFSAKNKNGGKFETTTLWNDWKKQISNLSDSVNDSTDALKRYRNFAQHYVDSHNMKQPSFKDRSNAFNIDFLGYIEGTIVDGKIVFKDALINAKGKYTFKYTQQGAVWVVPAYFYVQAGCGIGLTSQWARQLPDTNIPIDFGFILDIEPELKLGGGAGVKDAISAGIYGKGTFPYNNNFSKKHHSFKIKGEIGVEAEFFMFKGSMTVVDGELNVFDSYYGNSKSRALKRSNILTDGADISDMHLITSVAPRDYAENTSAWLPDAAQNRPLRAPSLAADGVRFTNLQTSIFSGAKPQLVSFGQDGEKMLAVWVQDDVSRDTYNRMRLVYSVYDNGKWSTPKPVSDDGNNDGYPSLASDGENVYVAWQKINKKLTEADSADLTSLMKNSEIYLAEFNTDSYSFEIAERITSNLSYDYLPKVTVLNGSPVLYWANCTDNNANGNGNNIIYKYSNGSVSKAVENLNYVLSVAAEKDRMSYITDTDSNYSTTNDINVFTLNNGKSAEFSTESDIAVTSAVYADLDGENTLFVSDSSNIYYYKNSQKTTVLEDERAIEGNINAVAADNTLSLVWIEKDNIGNELYSVSYKNGEWTKPVKISTQDKTLSDVNIVLNNGKLFGLCTSSAVAIDSATGNITKGQTDLCSFTVNDFCDIAVDSLFVDESSLIPGEKGSIDVVISNNGTEDVNAVNFTMNTGNTRNTVNKNVNLRSGSSQTVTLDLNMPADYTNTTVSVNASPVWFTDSDTSDNIASIEIGSADIVVTEKDLSQFGDNYVLTAVVKNTGIADAKAVTVKTAFAENSDTAEEKTIGNMSYGDYADIEFLFNKESLVFGEDGTAKVYISAVTDSKESVDANNKICVIIEDDSDSECEHTSVETVSETSPTCDKDGSVISICSECGKQFTKTVPELGHSYGEWTVDYEATCTAAGVNKRTCAVCGNEEFEDTSVLTHVPQVVKGRSATCTEEGLSDGEKCSVCGKILKEQAVISPIGHISGEWKVISTATCSEYGRKEKHCSVCGDLLETDVLEKFPHLPGEWTVTKPAEIGVQGEKTLSCAVCGNVIETRIIPALVDREEPTSGSDPTVTKPPVTDSQNKNVSFNVDTVGKIKAGEYIDIKVTLDNAVGLTDGSFDLSFDQSVLQYVSCETVYIANGGSVAGIDKDGIFRCALAYMNYCTTDSLYLFTVRFKVIKNSDTVLSLRSSDVVFNSNKTVSPKEVKLTAEKTLTNHPVTNPPITTEPAPSYMLGDINGDNRVTSADARAALRIALRLDSVSGAALLAANVNGDDKVTSADSRIILRVALKLQQFD